MVTYEKKILKEFVEFCESKGDELVDLVDDSSCALQQFGQALNPDLQVFGSLDDFEVEGRRVQVLPYGSIFGVFLGRGYPENSRAVSFAKLASALREEYSSYLGEK